MVGCLCKTQLFLVSFFFFLLSLHANLTLDPSDHKAIVVILKDLGAHGQLNFSVNPCSSQGVFCERRLSILNNYVLRITRLVFKSRQLHGFLSAAVGKLSELKELSLSNNILRDQIPSTIVDCRKLEILDLANNSFVGEIPSDLSSLTRLRVLDVSSNKFSGDLNFLKQLPNLEHLSLADNLFTGRVPNSLRSFRKLRHFNFSVNRFLEGSKPVAKRVQNFRTDVPNRFILAENSTTGRRRNQTSAAAPIASKSSIAPAPAPSRSQIHSHRNRRKKVIGKILGFIAGAFAGITVGLIFSFLFKLALLLCKYRGLGKPGIAIFSPLIKKAEDLSFLEKEDGLASMEIIGRGGCGEVYRADLPRSNGKLIAIKKIVQPTKDAAELAEEESRLMTRKMRQIKSEINTVGRIRHRNLLPLLAHVSRPDCHYLIYEYMKNGSLQDALKQVEEGTRKLDWLTRHKIAVGIASGLEYLHTYQTPRIIHRDLKPGNVLLDDDMEARISDFGLATTMPDAQTHMTASSLAGTVGYIAPEYCQILKFTDKSDVYSFGIILAILVVGKLPSDEFFQCTEEMSLVKWVRSMLTSEDPKQAIDARLKGNGYEEQMLLVLKIACFCTVDDPKERPNSKDVRCMLSQIKH